MKLIVFDLDDTLLNSMELVSERNRQAILRCSRMGMKVGYITARSPRKIQTFLQDLPCDCIAYYNGAAIYADSKLIAENTIKHEEAIQFMNKVIEVAPEIKITAYFEPFCYKEGRIRNIVTKECVGDDFSLSPEYDFQRIRLVYQGYEYIDFSRYANDKMQYHATVPNSAVITDIYADKGKALETLLRYYDINKELVISFGDDINDIPMLKASGTGVAMGNAAPAVKSIADYITSSNDEDGVAEYIENYLL